jgi:mevalonate kinase
VSDVTALQSCLAGEHAAVYAYGVLAAVINDQASGTPADHRASRDYIAHRQRRDRLIDSITARGATPVAAQPAYGLPFPVMSVASAVRLARLVERRLAATYASAAGHSVTAVRAFAAGALADAAIATVSWGAAPTAFPGSRPN